MPNRSRRFPFPQRLYAVQDFDVGSANDVWDLWDQVVVSVHEHRHVVQHDREGLSLEVSYVADRAARARFEAEAYRSNLEMHFWRHGATTRSRPLAELLHDYGCRPEDVEIAAHSLALANVSVRRGAVLNESTRSALDWLDNHAPHHAPPSRPHSKSASIPTAALTSSLRAIPAPASRRYPAAPALRTR